jgi:hypothetical protein
MIARFLIVPGWLRHWRPTGYPRSRRELPRPAQQPPRPAHEPLRRAAELLRRDAGDRRDLLKAAMRQLDAR